MDEELKKKIDEQSAKIDALYKSIEKIRKYFVWTAWITILAIVVPMILLAFALPSFFSNYVAPLNSLGM